MSYRSPETSSEGAPSAASNDIVASVATTLEQIVQAWSFVYDRYHRAGRIPANPWRIHTVRPAVSQNSAVIVGWNGGELINTMTVHFDGPEGLSLDSIYKEELDTLRRQGRTLAEVGLFADRRTFCVRSIKPLLQLMRLAWCYTVSHEINDGIIGVHPRHASFYMRWLGFERFGPTRHYPLVDAPTVLLRLDWRKALQQTPMPRGYPVILSNPVGKSFFHSRFRLCEQSIAGSSIAEFLKHSARQ